MKINPKITFCTRDITASIHSPSNSTVEEIIHALGQANYDGIDYSEIGRLRPNIRQLKQWRKMAEKAGLFISSMHFRDYGFGALINPERRATFLEDAIEDLKIASILGCRDIAFHIADTPDSSREHFIKANIDLFREPARIASEIGIILCLENHYPTKYGRTTGDLLAIIEGLDSHSNLGICIDTGHSILAGQNPAKMIHEAGSYLKMLHLNDNMGHKDTHLSPGLGIIDWFAIFAALDRIEFDGPLNMEIGGHHPHDKISDSASSGYHNILQLLSEYYIIAEKLQNSSRHQNHGYQTRANP